MNYFEVDKTELWTSDDTAVLNSETMKWEPAKPELMYAEFSLSGLKEWFVHTVLKKHFSYGQPYCVMCGYGKKDNPTN